MKKKFQYRYFLPILLFFYTPTIQAQYFEVGLEGGIANYLGDLTPSGMWTSAGDADIAAGAMVRFNWVDWVSLRAGFHYGEIGASDANANNAVARKSRNLSFRSAIYEFSLTTEINIFGYRPYASGKSFAPYFYLGIAGFKFNPQANWNGQWHDLQPLGTEGQGMAGLPAKYKKIQLSIPAGFGVKYALNEHFNFGLQAGMRKTFTDYLDDVSGYYPDLEDLAGSNGDLAAELAWRGEEVDPEANVPKAGTRRGDPKDLDWYIFTGASISYNFLGPSKRSRKKVMKIKCPKF